MLNRHRKTKITVEPKKDHFKSFSVYLLFPSTFLFKIVKMKNKVAFATEYITRMKIRFYFVEEIDLPPTETKQGLSAHYPCRKYNQYRVVVYEVVCKFM